MKIKTLFLITLINLSYIAKSQTIITKPNFGQKSHPTLEIENIKITDNQTIIQLSITNKSPQGDWFCVDKKVELIDILTNKKYRLASLSGIPHCPETYKFTQVNEKLQFELRFPAIDKNTKYITLVEKCNNACFSIEGIILNENLNKKIDEAYSAFAKGLDFEALQLFKEARTLSSDYPYPLIKNNIEQIQKIVNKK